MYRALNHMFKHYKETMSEVTETCSNQHILIDIRCLNFDGNLSKVTKIYKLGHVNSDIVSL